MIRPLLASLAFTLAAPAALAQEPATMIGPEVGAAAPDFFAINAETGATVMLDTITGDTGAVLVFSRSLDWCPFCKKQALDLIEATEPLAEKGWELNLITYDDPATLASYAAEKDVNYTLLSDTNSAMIDAFELRNEEMDGRGRYEGIPHPAIVFIGADGEVKAMLREEGYKDRPPVETVLETANALADPVS